MIKIVLGKKHEYLIRKITVWQPDHYTSFSREPSWMSPNIHTPVVNDRCYIHTYRTVILIAQPESYVILVHIDMVKNSSYSDGRKGLHTNCSMASCFVSYAYKHLSDYCGIAWFIPFLLLVLCAVNLLLTGGFPYFFSLLYDNFHDCTVQSVLCRVGFVEPLCFQSMGAYSSA